MPKNKFNLKAKIIQNHRMAGNYFDCVIDAPQLAHRASPGQFIQLRVKEATEPLLRRPFGIHRVKDNTVKIIYEVVGPATKILSQRKSGEYLDIIGPLGNGFDYHTPQITYPISVLVAGGMGVAPLLFLAEKLKRQKILVLIGAKTKNDILCEKEFQDLGCDVKIATNDGSRGFKGKATELLEKLLLESSRTKEPKNQIYACGPRPMLREISRLSRMHKLPAQISLEEHMGCGIGACMGCVVETKKGYQRVCKEGPVFNANEIIWK